MRIVGTHRDASSRPRAGRREAAKAAPWAHEILEALRAHNVSELVYLPDTVTGRLLALSEQDAFFRITGVHREEEVVGILTGLYLGRRRGAMAGIDNLVHVVWDSGGWEITGAQPAGSAFGVQLETIARGSGFINAITVDSLDEFRTALSDALAAQERWFICARQRGRLQPPSSAQSGSHS